MNIFCKDNEYYAFLISSFLTLTIFISSSNLNSNFSPTFLINEFMYSDILTPAFGDQQEFSKQQAIEKFKNQFCGINSKPNSNQYIKEIKLNNECEMPLAIIYDDNVEGLWYISTKQGSLILYQPESHIFTKYDIPTWPSRNNPIDSSQVWDLKLDPSNENLWFTDEKQNLIWKFSKQNKEFEHFKIPETNLSFGTIYPVSIDFDNNGHIFFAGIRSQSLWMGNLSLMKSSTSDGIAQIPLPVESFKDFDPSVISTGSIVVDKKNNNVWVSVLAFGYKGQIYKYDITNKSFKKYDLGDLPSPVGMTIDEKGNIWVSDHGTSIFVKLNPINSSLTKFITSTASQKIFAGEEVNGQAYTLPYWMKKGQNNSIIFNEHTGNKIGKFFPDELKLVEYWIPSQNKLFGQCKPDLPENSCGIGNVLQLTDETYNRSIWFTEWSENKIGYVNTSIPLPFSIKTENNEMTLTPGESKEIRFEINAHNDSSLSPISSSTLTPSGDLGTSYGIFSENSIALKKDESKEISFVFTLSNDVAMGNYILMLGAEDDIISISKAILIKVI
ncbi:MAG: Vgb family protein [Nitrososphaeraceae archaeon]